MLNVVNGRSACMFDSSHVEELDCKWTSISHLCHFRRGVESSSSPTQNDCEASLITITSYCKCINLGSQVIV